MFYGGALFGVIDHFWNKELFYISENIFSDLTLGVVITAGIVVFWKLMITYSKKIPIN